MRLASVLLYLGCQLLPAASAADQTVNATPFVQAVTIQPGTHVGRYFGDLLIECDLDKTGLSAICMLYLTTQLVGIKSLTAEAINYPFDVQLADSKSSGSLTLNLAGSGQISTIAGSFTYTAVANNTAYTFRGDLFGWVAGP